VGEPRTDRLSICLLGHFEVRQTDRAIIDESWPHSKARALLKLLALAPDRALRRDDVIDALWPELPPAPAAANLRKSLHQLRTRFAQCELASPIERAGGEMLQLSTDVELDVDEFRREATAARSCRQLAAYEQALGRYAGEILPHDTYEDWTQAPRADLAHLHAELSFDRATLLLARGRTDEGVAALERLCTVDATNEQAHRLLMRLHAQAGRRERALRIYQSCAEALRRELEVEPAEETEQLHREIAEGQRTLTGLPTSTLVARDPEIGQAHNAMQAALHGQPQVLLVSGEPGIGKTELVERASYLAQLWGFIPARGQCHEESAMPAFWPWMQIIERCEEFTTESRRAADTPFRLRPADGHTVRVGTRELAESEGTRAQLFESVLAYLRNVAEHRPLLLILEDVHWVDQPSMLLLAFLARELHKARIVVLATYRDAEVASHAGLADALAGVRGLPRTTYVELPPFDINEVGSFVRESIGVYVATAVAKELHARTGGNPLFLKEMIRSGDLEVPLGGSGAITFTPGVMPSTVRDVIRKRIARLSPDAERALAVAAVVGADFRLSTVAAATNVDPAHTAAALDEAASHGVIESAGSQPGYYRFSHVLFRDAIYEDLPTGDRMIRHREVAETIAARPDADRYASALAYHYGEAAPLGFADQAAEYARSAGDEAKAAVAYEDAVDHYLRAIRFREEAGLTDGETGMEILLSLGEAYAWAGHGTAAADVLLEASGIARRIGSSDGFARIAIAYKVRGRPTAPDPRLRALCEEAVEMLPETDSSLRAVLLATLAWSLRGSYPNTRGAALFAEAIMMVRRVDDPHALHEVLSRWYDSEWSPDNIHERLSVAEELMDVGRKLHDPRRENSGAYRRLIGLLETGNIQEFDRCLETHFVLAERVQQHDVIGYCELARSTRCVLEGRFDRAEQHAEAARLLFERYEDPDAFRIFASQLFAIRWPQGRLAELEPASKMFSVDNAVPGWRVSLALLAVEADKDADARAEFERFAVTNFDLPRDRTWLICIVVLSEICRALGDTARAAILYDHLRPYEEYCAVLSYSEVCLGSNARSLGVLAAMLHRWDAAERHFEKALDVNARMGALSWLAQTQFDYAEMLLARRQPGGVEHAASLLESAKKTAEQIGMARLLTRIVRGECRA